MAHCRNARAFLHCSSTGVYEAADGAPQRETDPLGDNHRVMMPTYSISKIAAEAVVRTTCRHVRRADDDRAAQRALRRQRRLARVPPRDDPGRPAGAGAPERPEPLQPDPRGRHHRDAAGAARRRDRAGDDRQLGRRRGDEHRGVVRVPRRARRARTRVRSHRRTRSAASRPTTRKRRELVGPDHRSAGRTACAAWSRHVWVAQRRSLPVWHLRFLSSSARSSRRAGRWSSSSIDDPQAKWAKTIEVAELAEELGYDSIWVYDHFHNVPVPAHETMFECWTTLAAISQRTTRIRLGQMVGCAPYRNPGAARQDHVEHRRDQSGGRLDWGIGAGWYEHEFTGYGYEFPRREGSHPRCCARPSRS